ncbi:hypothetical protein [Microbacterium luteum]|uniref:hypothetical protein n=1 Tax=Microbacterium luteum TaxID=2782167 RepID=UPI001887A4AA|nr:hypothetical protein [Microbacterium luteum]
MREDSGLSTVLDDGYSRHLLIDVLHGSDLVASNVFAESWDLDGNTDRDPLTTGRVRIVHSSINGESWVPTPQSGILSPFRATLILTEVIEVGSFSRRVQLGMFDVIDVPYAEDITATYGHRWQTEVETSDDLFEDVFTETFPGESVVVGGGWVGNAHEIVVASIVDLEIVSLDSRPLGASFRSPRTSLTSAWSEWRKVGLLPVIQTGADAVIPRTVWPAADGSRLDDIQACATALGGIPVVDSFGQWVLADDNTPTVEIRLGETGTIVDMSSALTTDGFANVIVGNYETEAGVPLRAEWVAPGYLAPSVMGREIVRFHTSSTVRTQGQADAAVAAQGAIATSQDIDVEIECIYNPLLELGDHVTVPGENVSGVVRRLRVSDEATMQVTVRMRRAL